METPPTLVPVINLGDLAPLIGDLDLLMGDLVPSAATFIDTLSFLPNWPFPPATGGRAKNHMETKLFNSDARKINIKTLFQLQFLSTMPSIMCFPLLFFKKNSLLHASFPSRFQKKKHGRNHPTSNIR